MLKIIIENILVDFNLVLCRRSWEPLFLSIYCCLLHSYAFYGCNDIIAITIVNCNISCSWLLQVMMLISYTIVSLFSPREAFFKNAFNLCFSDTSEILFEFINVHGCLTTHRTVYMLMKLSTKFKNLYCLEPFSMTNTTTFTTWNCVALQSARFLRILCHLCNMNGICIQQRKVNSLPRTFSFLLLSAAYVIFCFRETASYWIHLSCSFRRPQNRFHWTLWLAPASQHYGIHFHRRTALHQPAVCRILNSSSDGQGKIRAQ